MYAPYMYCPNCKELHYAEVDKVSPEPSNSTKKDKPVIVMLDNDDAGKASSDDIYYYKRKRRCRECGESFYTAELEEKYIDELVNRCNQVNQLFKTANQLLYLHRCVDNIIKKHVILQTLNQKYQIRPSENEFSERLTSLLQELHPSAMEKIKKMEEIEDFEASIESAVVLNSASVEGTQNKKIADLLFEDAPNEVKEIMELFSKLYSVAGTRVEYSKNLAEANRRLVEFIDQITDLFGKNKYLTDSISESIGKYIEEV